MESQPTTARLAAQRRRCNQRLDLDQQWARALDAREDRGAGTGRVTVAEEQRRRVRNLDQAGACHLEDADLVRGAEPVLDGAENAERVSAIAFEVQHGVDHVLDHLRAGDVTVLGDMTDKQHRAALRFGVADEAIGSPLGLG